MFIYCENVFLRNWIDIELILFEMSCLCRGLGIWTIEN